MTNAAQATPSSGKATVVVPTAPAPTPVPLTNGADGLVVDPSLIPPPVTGTVPELLAQLKTQTETIRGLIDKGSFGSIYVPAFQAKDIALALVDDHKKELPEDKQRIAEPAVAKLMRAAWLLDAFGDIGNKQQIVDAFAEFRRGRKGYPVVVPEPAMTISQGTVRFAAIVRRLRRGPRACRSQRGEAHKAITSKYTYNDDVFPIVRAKCGNCHVDGGVAPMSLMTYEEAFPWAESIRARARGVAHAAVERGGRLRRVQARAPADAERAGHDSDVGDRRQPARPARSEAAGGHAEERVGARQAGPGAATAGAVRRVRGQDGGHARVHDRDRAPPSRAGCARSICCPARRRSSAAR